MKLRRPQYECKSLPRTTEVAAAQNEPSGRRFNPEVEITDEDWKNIKQELDSKRDEWWDFSSMAADIILFFPERKNELGLDEKTWDNMITYINLLRLADRADFLQGALSNILILFPERKNELGLDDDQEWAGMLDRMEIFRNLSWVDFAKMARGLLILHPEKRDDLMLNEDAWNGMIQELEVHRGSKWYYYASLAMNMRLLFPDKKIELDKNLWEAELNRMDNTRAHNKWSDFATIAATLSILSADEVHLTDDGIKLTHNDDPFDQISSLPGRNLAI